MSSRTCSECGTPAEPGQAFCDTCRAVLSWSPDSGSRPARAPAPAPPAPPAPPTPPAPPAPPGPRPSEVVPVDPRRLPGTGYATAAPRRPPSAGAPVDPRVPHAAAPAAGSSARRAAADAADRPATGGVRLGKGGHRPTPAPRPPADPSDPPSDPATTATTVPVRRPGPDAAAYGAEPPAAAPPEPAAPPLEMADRARNLLVPVADPAAPAAEEVLPALPGRPSPAPMRSRGPGAEPGVAGGVPCGWCGTPNRTDRHFCARCAMPMDAGDGDDEPDRLPWWRRLLGGDDRRVRWAGERPRVRRTYAHLVRWVAAAAIGALLVAGLVRLPAAISATQDHFAKRTAVDPDQYGASRSFEGHPPDNAFDQVSDTWWGPGVGGAGTGEWIQADFDRATSILDLVITPGRSTRARDLATSAQPRRIEVLVTTEDGESFTREIELARGLGPKRVPFRAHDVRSIRFTVVTAHNATDETQVAIAEIELFGPSGSYGR